MNESSSIPKTNTKDNGFYFQRPEHKEQLSREANVAISIGAIASRLVSEERTRTIHPDGRAENVAEHSLMLVKVSVRLAQVMYPHLDAGKIAIKAADHDDVEAYVCDTATDRITEDGRQEKAQREALGSHQLVHEYASLVPEYASDHIAYETQEDPHDRFVRVVDKIMVLLIHIPNQGKILRENYTYDEFMQRTYDEAARLLRQYPEYVELIELRTEIATYIGNTYYNPSNYSSDVMIQFHK